MNQPHNQPTCVRIPIEEVMKARNEVLASPFAEMGFANVGRMVSSSKAVLYSMVPLTTGESSGTSFSENAQTVATTNRAIERHNRMNPLARAVKSGIAHSHPLSVVNEEQRKNWSTTDLQTIRMRTNSEYVHLLFSINKNGSVVMQAVNGLAQPMDIELVMPDGSTVLIGPNQPKGKLARALAPYLTPPDNIGNFSIGQGRVFNPHNPIQYPQEAANDPSIALAA